MLSIFMSIVGVYFRLRKHAASQYPVSSHNKTEFISVDDPLILHFGREVSITLEPAGYNGIKAASRDAAQQAQGRTPRPVGTRSRPSFYYPQANPKLMGGERENECESHGGEARCAVEMAERGVRRPWRGTWCAGSAAPLSDGVPDEGAGRDVRGS